MSQREHPHPMGLARERTTLLVETHVCVLMSLLHQVDTDELRELARLIR